MALTATAGGTTKSVPFKPENIWDLATVERLLRILFDDSTTYASEQDLEAVRSNRDFVQYVLKITSDKLEALRSSPEYWQVQHSKRIFGHLCECAKIVYDRCIKKTTELCGNGNSQVALNAGEAFRQALLTALAVYQRKVGDFLRLISCTIGSTFKSELLNGLHEIVDKYFEDGAESEAASEKTIANLFLCLEILYQSNVLETQHLDLAYTWLQNFCSNTKLKLKSLGFVHRILFELRMRTQTGAYFDTVSMLVERKFGQIEEDELAPSFTLKSISSLTVESALVALCNVTKQQLDDVNHFILRTNSVLGRLKIYGHGENDEYLHQLKSIERSMCSQLVHIMSVTTHLANTQLPLGVCMDSLLKLLANVYICLSNLTKHFINRHSVSAVSHDSTKFNLVIKSSKPLAVRIYNLFPFIEENILGQSEEPDSEDDSNDKAKQKLVQNAKKNREKVLRQTKLIPKLVFRIETFNKFVLLLSKKTKKDLTYLLHIGTVRDFRIKEPALVEAIKQACDGELGAVGSDLGDLADLDVPQEEDDAIFLRPTESSLVGASLGPEESQLNEQESNTENSDVGDENQALKNLALLNERSKRKARKKRSSADESGEAERDDDSDNNGKRRKVTKKKAESPKINKRALEKIDEVAAVAVTTAKTLGPTRRASRGAKKS